MKEILIGKYKVGHGHRPFIIAELSGNHNGSLERALRIVDEIAKTGAQAVKLQTYTADTMTLDVKDGDFYIDNPDSLWHGRSLHELYQEAYTPWEWHEPIIKRCQEHGMVCFSTPFDHTAVDFLESLNVPCYKIASFENTDLPLIEKVASLGKPVIISTGMANLAELDETVRVARKAGCKDLILLKCTSNYPASPIASNIATIPHMEKLFQCQIGLSDHTLGIGVAIATVALGATVIEKHVTLARADGGVDSAFSLEPWELKMLMEESERAWQSVGIPQYGPTTEEVPSLQFRRSLYIAQDMKAGDVFTKENLRAVRPGYGLPTKFIKNFIGRKTARAARKGTRLSWEMLVG